MKDDLSPVLRGIYLGVIIGLLLSIFLKLNAILDVLQYAFPQT
jgi:hypothetical protein